MHLAIVLFSLSVQPVAASSYACSLTMDCGGLLCADRTAKAWASTDGRERDPSAVWTIKLAGTHQNPDWLDREEAAERVFDGQQVTNWQDMSIRFGDSRTVGTLSFDYGGKAALSLHVASSDRAYFEHFTGFCEVQH